MWWLRTHTPIIPALRGKATVSSHLREFQASRETEWDPISTKQNSELGKIAHDIEHLLSKPEYMCLDPQKLGRLAGLLESEHSGGTNCANWSGSLGFQCERMNGLKKWSRECTTPDVNWAYTHICTSDIFTCMHTHANLPVHMHVHIHRQNFFWKSTNKGVVFAMLVK